MKAVGTKLQMTQIFKGDVAMAITPISFASTVDISWLQEGMRVAARGTSRGLGFQGVVKRHGFHGGPKTHGQKNRYRAPGSIGNTTPQRVIPGRRMAGRMGGEHVTVKNLLVAKIDTDKHVVMLRGAVPGYRSGKVEIIA